jgi:hypothetical protein
MLRQQVSWAGLASLALALFIAGCDDDDDDGLTGVGSTRVFRQIERLGNPLVSEVTFPKRDHGFHNSTAPSADSANGFHLIVQGFVDTFRPGATVPALGGAPLGEAIAGVLIPDALIVQTDRDGSTAGWLSWAVADGYGGRRLTDDVVDVGLMAIFGPLLSPDAPIAGLSTDNVPLNDKEFLTTFPYLATPH